jgi:HSP20 family molecular chaperone IbpA
MVRRLKQIGGNPMSNLIPRRDDLFFPIEQAFDGFFNDFFSKSSPLSKVKGASGYPKMNAWRNESEFGVTFAVPGMSSDDLDVEIDSNNTLTVRGKMSSEHESPKGSSYYLKELRQSAFERSVVLPDFVDGDPVTSMKDGILTLTWDVQKKPEVEGVRKIFLKSD